MSGRLSGNPVLMSNARTRKALAKFVKTAKRNEKRLKNM